MRITTTTLIVEDDGGDEECRFDHCTEENSVEIAWGGERVFLSEHAWRSLLDFLKDFE